MLKKTFFIFLLGLICVTAMAQPRSPKHQPRHNPRHLPAPQPAPHYNNFSAPTSTIYITATHNEEFIIYVDGKPINKRAKQKLTIQNLPLGPHEIFVVQTFPFNRTTTQSIVVSPETETFFVFNNPELNCVELVPQKTMQHIQQTSQQICSFEEIEHYYHQIDNENFDDNRLHLAKILLKDKYLNTSQITRLIPLFKFENTKVEFLKFAYDRCLDRDSFYECINELNFSSDKKKLYEFIGY